MKSRLLRLSIKKNISGAHQAYHLFERKITGMQ